MKEFGFWEHIAKLIIADAVSNVTSAVAANFLRKAIRETQKT